MYNVRLDKEELNAGRQLITTFFTSVVRRDYGLLPGTSSFLRAFMERGEANIAKYSGYDAISKLSDREKGIGFSWYFLPGVTQLTIAAELAQLFPGYMELVYLPKEDYVPTNEQRQLYNETNRLLHIMAKTIEDLIAEPEVAEESWGSDQRRMRELHLEHARHLAEVGIAVTAPENASHHYPQAHEWRTRLARVKEAVAKYELGSAKADRAAAVELRKPQSRF